MLLVLQPQENTPFFEDVSQCKAYEGIERTIDLHPRGRLRFEGPLSCPQAPHSSNIMTILVTSYTLYRGSLGPLDPSAIFLRPRTRVPLQTKFVYSVPPDITHVILHWHARNSPHYPLEPESLAMFVPGSSSPSVSGLSEFPTAPTTSLQIPGKPQLP